MKPIKPIIDHYYLTDCFPIDKTVIATWIPLKNVVGTCPENNLDLLPPDLRPFIHHIKPDSKQDAASTLDCAGSPQRYNPKVATRSIYLNSFHGITLRAEDHADSGWIIHSITFNPGSVCFGHNGHVLNEGQFLHACSDLIECVEPLLENPRDRIHILPGLCEQSRAWWKYVEIPFHLLDAGGKILRAYSRGKHPQIHVAPLHMRNGQSITFEGSTGELLIRVYRKDLEMRKKFRKKVTNNQPVLRIEVSLRGDKLGEFLEGGAWKTIDGKKRLVGFRASNLRAAHYAVMSKFQGVYTKCPSENGSHDQKLGRHMAWVLLKTGLSLEEQIDHQVERHHADHIRTSIANTKSALRKAARDELGLLSTVNLSDLFHEKAWKYQPCVSCRELEQMVNSRNYDVRIDPLVEEKYGSGIVALTPDIYIAQ